MQEPQIAIKVKILVSKGVNALLITIVGPMVPVDTLEMNAERAQRDTRQQQHFKTAWEAAQGMFVTPTPDGVGPE